MKKLLLIPLLLALVACGVSNGYKKEDGRKTKRLRGDAAMCAKPENRDEPICFCEASVVKKFHPERLIKGGGCA